MCSSWKLQRVMVEATQQEIASQAGLSRQRLGAIERGELKPTPEEKAALIRVLGELTGGMDQVREVA